MKRLLTALLSATLLATFFAGTPAPTFASATEEYYIGYGSGSDTGCGEPDFVVNNSNYGDGRDNGDRLEDNIQLALDVVDDGDTIIICAGWYTLHGDMALWNGDLDDGAGVNPINITIQGAGAGDTVVSGYSGYYNAFAFENTNLTLTDMTIWSTDSIGPDTNGGAVALENGNLTVENVDFNNYSVDAAPGGAHDGGAIAIYNGDLSVTDSNFDQTTGWYSVVRGDGGAIWSDHSNSTPNSISITGTTFDGNSSNGKGGAVWAYCADMTVADSEFFDNSTGARGGAVYAESDNTCTGELTISDSSFEGNRIDGDFGGNTKWRHMGGAIYSVGQDMTVTNSSFGADGVGNGNRATNGGAIAMFDGTTGTATLTVSDTDFSENYSPANGGALWLACVDATITGDADGTWDSYLEGTSSTFWSNGAEQGGAIYLFGDGDNDNECPDGSQGSLTVEGVAFDDNNANYHGGAISTQQSDVALAYVDISHSVFYSNAADGSGGAVNTDNVDLTIDHSLFLANSADSDGGALEVSGVVSDADLVITDSEFTDNNTVGGDDGGAIAANQLTLMSISGSLFLDNESEEHGGAIHRTNGSDAMDEISSTDFVSNESGPDDDGGAIWTDHTTGITDSTFDDNTTGIDAYGGAIHSRAFLSVSGSEFHSNYSWYHGGAIYVAGNGSGLTVENSTFTNNESRWDEGGAIYADFEGQNCPTDTCITVLNSLFQNNEAESGGAVWARESITIQDSEFVGNDASDDGGALDITANAALIKNSIFRANRAGWGDGGAIDFYGAGIAKLTVQASTFTDNSAGGDYGYGTSSPKDGGAIYADSGDLSIAGSTFTGNHSSSNGGAVYSEGPLTVSGSLFSRNEAVYFGGAVFVNAFGNIESNVMRNNSAGWFGGAVFFDSATQASNFSRNLVDANTAYNGGGVAIFGSDQGSNRMTIHTNRIWNNVASNNGGGLWANFTEAGALYELATGIKSTMFVRNRAIYGAAGLVEVNSVTKANQRIFTSLTKSNKYQLNRSTMRGWDKLMLKLEPQI